MTISNLNLNSINFQSALRSKPVRENFTDIQNKMNEQNTAINALSTASSGAEVSAARDYHTDLQSRLQSACKNQGNQVITGGVCSEGSTNVIDTTAGEAIIDGVACKWSAASSAALTPCASGKIRFDIVVVNSDSTLSIVAGAEVLSAAQPDLPSTTATQKALALIRVDDTVSCIAGIHDVRFVSVYYSYSGNMTLNLMSRNRQCLVYSSPSCTITIPPNSTTAFSIGDRIDFIQYEAAALTLVAGAGVTIGTTGATLKTNGQYSKITIEQVETDVWILSGDIAAS